MTARTDHVALAQGYIDDVLSGRIVACRYVRLACERQLRELELAEAGKIPYRFDAAAAGRICRFIELLPHVKGKWARITPDNPTAHLIRLEPWQCFGLTTVFGWLDVDDGSRRFRTVYEEVARKNAKSTKLAGVGLYMFVLDDEPGAEVYVSATKRDQARIVFSDASRMVEKLSKFRLRHGIDIKVNRLVQPSEGNVFAPLDAKGSTQDGLNVHFAINDELHAHKRRDLYDVLHSGMGSREQPLEWNITTAGRNRSGVCYEQRAHTIKVLEGVIEDPSHFGIIYTLDEGDDWTDEQVWIKANPNLGVSKFWKTMRSDCNKAQASAQSQNEFLTKHMNLWVNADVAWMNMEYWGRQKRPGLTLEDFRGERCWAGLDLASKIDLASLSFLFERGEDLFLILKHYLPEDRLKEPEGENYVGWARDGWITTTPGARNDFTLIENEVARARDELGIEIVQAGVDPAQSATTVNNLQEKGITCIEVAPWAKYYSPAMKEIDARVRDGTLWHCDDPVFTWMISNTVCHTDAKDQIYPRKEQPENKIDGVVASIIAMNRYLAIDDSEKPWHVPSSYECHA